MKKPRVRFQLMPIRALRAAWLRRAKPAERLAVLAIVAGVATGCAARPVCPPQAVETRSVCVGQQSVIRYRDFIAAEYRRGAAVCPPVVVVTAQLCGR